MENKPLVIDVIQGASPNGSVNTWNVLANINDFISAISTPSLSENADYGAIVSGFPTAFARVDLFKAAFDAATAKNSSEADKNLAKYYEELVSEWRGFVACLALDYANVRAKRIDLVYIPTVSVSRRPPTSTRPPAPLETCFSSAVPAGASRESRTTTTNSPISIL